MSTEYTKNFALALPDFRTGPWHDLVNGDFTKIDQLMFGALSQTDIELWTNNTAYSVGVTVIDSGDGSTWMCGVDHISHASGTFQQDRTAHPTYWTRLLNGFAPKGEWAYSTHYFPYDMVYQTSQGVLALCKTEHVSRPSGTIIDDAVYWSFLVDFHNIGLSTALAVTYSNAVSPRFTAVNVQQALDQTEDMITSLDNVNITQGTRLTNLEAKDVVHETRMTNIETKNTAQDTVDTGLQTQITNMGTAKVSKSGDLMTGNLTIQSTDAKLILCGPATSKSMVHRTGGVTYYMVPADDAGVLSAFRPLSVDLATGNLTLCSTAQQTTIGGVLNVSGNVGIGGTFTLNNNGLCTGLMTFNGPVNIANALTVSNTLQVTQRITSLEGYTCRHGNAGPQGANTFNLFWTGSAMDVYVDNVLAGTVCDPRVKHNIKPLADNALKRINKLQAVSFNYRDIGIYKDDGNKHLGFLADNLAEFIPEAVRGELDAVDEKGDPIPVMIDPIAVIATLVQAVRELTRRVKVLER